MMPESWEANAKYVLETLKKIEIHIANDVQEHKATREKYEAEHRLLVSAINALSIEIGKLSLRTSWLAAFYGVVGGLLGAIAVYFTKG